MPEDPSFSSNCKFPNWKVYSVNKKNNIYEQRQLTTTNAQIFPIFLVSQMIPSLSKIMPWKAATPTSRCPACSGLVFANEAYMAADRTPFHMTCIKCGHCNKPLSPADINEHEKQLFCKICYEITLAPKVGHYTFPFSKLYM